MFTKQSLRLRLFRPLMKFWMISTHQPVQGLQLPGLLLELAGEIGRLSQSQRNYEQNLTEMTPAELSAIVDKWEGEK